MDDAVAIGPADDPPVVRAIAVIRVVVLSNRRLIQLQHLEGDLQCAVTLIAEKQLMQPSYRVEYLPETGTILSITDMAGRLRTGGAQYQQDHTERQRQAPRPVLSPFQCSLSCLHDLTA